MKHPRPDRDRGIGRFRQVVEDTEGDKGPPLRRETVHGRRLGRRIAQIACLEAVEPLLPIEVGRADGL